MNIFGGIVNCAIIANGITKACRELALNVPLVVRLEGENPPIPSHVHDTYCIRLFTNMNSRLIDVQPRLKAPTLITVP